MNFTNLTNYLDYLVNEVKTPGVDCIVYKNHEMIYRHFAGKSDIEANKDIAGDEIYIIYSMTKMITCTAALQLYEQGKYMLNDPIAKYLPEFEKMKITTDTLDTETSAKVASGSSMGDSSKNTEGGYAKNPITVMDLFTMSAGLDYNLYADGIKAALANGKTSTRDLVGAISQTILGFEPGTRFRYSLCHDVLGALVEIWSGKKLGEYMEENIFRPLGIKNTFFDVPKDEKLLSKMAARYNFNQDGTIERLPLVCGFNLSEDYESGGAGLCSCTEDYALFLDAMACGGMGKSGNRILSAETVKLMGTDHLSGQRSTDFDAMRPGYGYGLGVRVHKDKTRSGSLSPLGEFGWDGAAGCFSMVDTENKISITYFQQIHSWNLRIQTGIRNALYSGIE